MSIKKFSAFLAVPAFIVAVLLSAASGQADGKREGKAEKIRRLRQNDVLTKPSAFEDRKIGVMDNGRMAVNYDNNGFIGDRNYTRSIEWPAGSINYLVWQVGIIFGGVTADGDTICSESYNDISDNQFNPEPGFDNPAFVWDILESPIVARSDLLESYAPQWNGLWPSLDGTFINPDELRLFGRQETYWVMRDNNDPEVSPQQPLNVEVVGRLMEINSSLTKDFVFAFYTVKNIGNQDLRRCRFGVLVDPDMPALVGAEFEDDDDGFIRELNLAYARDSDNFYASRPGLTIGHFGTKFLRSPEVNGQELGLTAWTTFEYGDMPAQGEFELTEDGPDENGVQFASRDHAQYAYMQPGLYMKPRFNTDVAYLMSAGEFDLPAGQSVEMGVAFIAAPDFEALIRNANAVQQVFDNNFIGPTAPLPPAVTAVPGNKSVTLYWDAEPSESSQDALTQRADFEGYRIYRSEAKGREGSWGTPTDNLVQYPNGFLPIAEYDVINASGQLAAIVLAHSNQVSEASIVSEGLADGSQPGDAEGVDNSTFFSNDNFQIIFDTDSTFQVLNSTQGVLLNYLDDLSVAVGFAVLDGDWVLAADNPDATHGVYRAGSHIYVTGMFTRIEGATLAGDVFTVDQRRNEPGKNAGLAHWWKDPSTLVNGYEYWYTVTAYDREDLALGVPVNENRPVTVADAFANDQTLAVIPQAPPAGFRAAAIDSGANRQIFSHTAGQADLDGFGLEVVDPRKIKSTTYEISFTVTDNDKTYTVTDIGASARPKVLSEQPFYDAQLDNAPMFDGLRLLVTDAELDVNLDSSGQTVFAGGDTLLLVSTEIFDGANDHDYLFKFVQNPEDSANFRYTYTDWDTGVPVTAPFFVLDLTTGDTLTVEILDTRADEGDYDGTYDVAERIVIGDTPYTGSGGYEANTYSYRLGFEGTYAAGTEFRIITNKPLTVNDRYQFSTIASNIDDAKAKSELDLIRVVPNPFVVTSGFDTVRDRHEIHFTRLPLQCTIKIFSLAGELVKTIAHNADVNGASFERWDLKTEFGSEVAYGVYLYHVDSPAGTKMGKLAIMR
ncbi:hypothetical protein L0337_35305 [candidate division KSB1 bacterium]|nr:hypothetical protein [candidate division KSB1 bacterium]